MRPLGQYADIHSHRTDMALRGDTVVSVTPRDTLLPGGTYSVGIHPWDTDRPVALADLKRLVAMARDSRVVAVGECGFDRLRGGPVEDQARLFDFHARLAARLGKPLVIHDVRSDDLLLAAARRHRPAPGMWIVHGYRGKPDAARRLLDAGFALSFGSRYNPDTVAITPPDRRYTESDSQPDA